MGEGDRGGGVKEVVEWKQHTKIST
jgi:hypothetical protein